MIFKYYDAWLYFKSLFFLVFHSVLNVLFILLANYVTKFSWIIIYLPKIYYFKKILCPALNPSGKFSSFFIKYQGEVKITIISVFQIPNANSQESHWFAFPIWSRQTNYQHQHRAWCWCRSYYCWINHH